MTHVYNPSQTLNAHLKQKMSLSKHCGLRPKQSTFIYDHVIGKLKICC